MRLNSFFKFEKVQSIWRLSIILKFEKSYLKFFFLFKQGWFLKEDVMFSCWIFGAFCQVLVIRGPKVVQQQNYSMLCRNLLSIFICLLPDCKNINDSIHHNTLLFHFYQCQQVSFEWMEEGKEINLKSCLLMPDCCWLLLLNCELLLDGN